MTYLLRKNWIFRKVDSWPEDRPDSTRWEAVQAKYIDSCCDELAPIEGAVVIPALIVGSKPWSQEDSAETLFPLSPETVDPKNMGLACGLSPTAGKVLLGSRYRGPAPAWATDRGEFHLMEETWFSEKHGTVTSCCVLAAGLWPQVSYRVTG